MSSLDDKRKRPDKSYGRKPYVVVNSENDTYNDMMTTIPRRAMLDQRLEKKSQFDKPYLEDGNYSDMEYGQAPTVPSFSNPKFNFPSFPGPVPTDLELPTAWGWPPCMLTLNGPTYCIKCAEDKDFVSQGHLDFVILRDGYFPGGIMEAQGIASANTTIYLNRSAYGNLDRSRAGEIKINEPAGGWNVGDILEAVTKCKDEEGNEIVGCTGKVRIFCRDKDCDCCTAPGYVAMTLDADNTDDTIDSSTPATVTVKDGCGPYNWSVSGTGYSIVPNGSSDLLAATVSVVGGTCGVEYAPTCVVTITDDCSTSVTKVLKHTGGSWTNICSWGAGSPCGWASCGNVTCNPGSPDVSSYGQVNTFAVRWRMQTEDCREPTCPWADSGPAGCVTLGYGTAYLPESCPTYARDCTSGRTCNGATCVCTPTTCQVDRWTC